MKRQASEADIKAFMKAVFPDGGNLATAAFDERHVLATATKLIADLRADNKGLRSTSNMRLRLHTELDEAHKQVINENRTLARALRNCYIMAKRELHRLSNTGRVELIHGLDSQAVERWQHVLRFCEEAGCKSDGVLRCGASD